MINKVWASAREALADVPDGAVVGIGGFGGSGIPEDLIDALIASEARHLTLVANNAGNDEVGLAAVLKTGRVDKIVCSFPRHTNSYIFDGLYRAGKLQLELVPQGTLAERLRAAAAGIGGFYTRTAVGTPLAEGKECRELDGRSYLLELPLPLDYALVKGEQGDRWGNLTYRKLSRNFGPVMAAAAKCTVASVQEIVELGSLDPESVVSPGVYVQRLVKRSASAAPLFSTASGADA